MRPNIDRTLLDIAWLMAAHGTCLRMQVGAIIARDGRIIASGYNGAPAGLPHCSHDEHDTDGCAIAVHAEVNAIAFAAKHGLSTEGATLFTTMSPCVACAQLIINAGIKRVVAGSEYRLPMGSVLLTQAGIPIDIKE